MTDQELIELVETRPPEEWTGEELRLLRERLAQSPELRAAVWEHVQLDAALGEALGEVQVSVERLVALSRAQTWRPLKYGLAISLLAAALGVGAFGIWKLTRAPGPGAAGAGGAGVAQVPPQGGRPGKSADGLQSSETPPGGNANPRTPSQTQGETAPGAGQAVELAQEPWVIAAMGAPAPPFAEAAFDDFAPEKTGIDELARWFAPIQPGSLQLERRRGSSPLLSGVVKLRAPWREDTALQIAVAEDDGFQIHVFSGREGVTLSHFRGRDPAWCAYTTTREAGQNTPRTLALAGGDDGRYRRVGEGSVSLHWHAGQLALARGDLLLASAPLAAFPEEVFIQGRARWLGIGVFRSHGLPPDPPPRPVVVGADQPAQLSWSEALPKGARWQKLADATVQLSADRTNAVASAAIRLPQDGLYEMIVQVEGAEAGTGVFLGDGQGPIARVGFFRDERSGRVTFGYLSPDDARETANFDQSGQPVPFAAPKQWLRLVLGLGVFKAWTSGDGTHWSYLPESFPPVRQLGSTHVGLYCLPARSPRKIAMRNLQVRELSTLTALAPAELCERAEALDDLPDLGAWLKAVCECEPEGVDPADWRRACALRTMAASPSPELGQRLLLALTSDGLRRPLAVETKLRLLEEAILLGDLGQRETAVRLAAMYEELARIADDQIAAQTGVEPTDENQSLPSPQAFSQIAAALRSAPTAPGVAIEAFPDALVRRQFLRLVQAQQWEQTALALRQWRFWDGTPAGRERERRQTLTTRMIDWALAAVGRDAPRLSPPADWGNPAAWRHPLIEELSKEGYNILAEFDAALEGGAYQDACQIISTADTAGALGLLPDSRENELLVSLAESVALALRDHPPLQTAMQEAFAPAGRLRVREAMADGDARRLQAATVQFMGTDAAALAHAWLGDRAASLGDFSRAITHYESALASCGAADRPAIAARLRLAAAMLGRDLGEPVQVDVEYGGVRLTAAEFERLVAESRAAHRFSTAGVAAAAESLPLPPPGAYALQPLWEFPGTRGPDLAQAPADTDWAARQLSLTPAGDRIYLSDSFQLVALDASSGQPKWTVPPAGEVSVHLWSGVSTRPLIAGDRLFWRRLTRDRPQLTCISAADGKLLWTASLASWIVVSEPLWLQEALYVLAVQKRQDRTLQLALLSLDEATGQMKSSVPLVEIRDYWDGRCPSDAVVSGDRIIATVAGCVLACDSAGHVRWLRRQTWLAPPLEQQPREQPLSPPIVAGQRVYVSQRGARLVQCLDTDTGRQIWQFASPDVWRVAALAGEVAVVEMRTGLCGLDAETGRLLWRREGDRRFEGAVGDASGRVLCLDRVGQSPERQWPELAWLDGATGAETARWPLMSLAGKERRVGPLAIHPGGAWLLAGEGKHEPKRTIYSVQPAAGPALAGRTRDDGFGTWIDDLPRKVGDELATALPGWRLVACQPSPRLGLYPWQNETNVAVTAATHSAPACFVRRVELPQDAAARLVLRVGREGDQSWTLEVRAAGRTLLSEEVSRKTAPSGWLEREVDLNELAGRAVWISLSQQTAADGQPAPAFWKGAQIVLADGKLLVGALQRRAQR
ncbi:MAG: PQQ-binding-like beta-propeller repeat protein [Planctomycetia bacterium]|nr:PQQ-binding-like beta-propeller repeat protein [Planctomycetia bacterium]